MPGSKQHVALDRRSLEAYLMGVVTRFGEVPASVWHLSDQACGPQLAVSSPKCPIWRPLVAKTVVLLALFQQCLAILPFASWFVYFLFPGDLIDLCS